MYLSWKPDFRIDGVWPFLAGFIQFCHLNGALFWLAQVANGPEIKSRNQESKKLSSRKMSAIWWLDWCRDDCRFYTVFFTSTMPSFDWHKLLMDVILQAIVFSSLHKNTLNRVPKLITYQKTESENSLSKLEPEFEKWFVFGPIWPQNSNPLTRIIFDYNNQRYLFACKLVLAKSVGLLR